MTPPAPSKVRMLPIVSVQFVVPTQPNWLRPPLSWVVKRPIYGVVPVELKPV
jgi:hypothetical protein